MTQELFNQIFDQLQHNQELQKEWENEYPEYAKSQPFYFGIKYTLTTHFEGPLTIAYGLAPENMAGKCLIINSDYRMETFRYGCEDMIKFIKK